MNHDWSFLARRFALRGEEPAPRDAPSVDRRVLYSGVAAGALISFFVPGVGFLVPFWETALAGVAGGVAFSASLWTARALQAAMGAEGWKQKSKRFAEAFRAQTQLAGAQALLLPRMAAILPAMLAVGVISMRKGEENTPEKLKDWIAEKGLDCQEAIEKGEERQAIALGSVEAWRLARRCAQKGEVARVASIFSRRPFDPRWPMPAAPQRDSSVFSPIALSGASGDELRALSARHQGKERSFDRALASQTQIGLLVRPWLVGEEESLAEAAERARALREGIELVLATPPMAALPPAERSTQQMDSQPAPRKRGMRL